jgi:hypothetical protein
MAIPDPIPFFGPDYPALNSFGLQDLGKGLNLILTAFKKGEQISGWFHVKP